MAEPTEVERLQNRISGWWPDNHMLRDDVDDLIAAVRAEALAETPVEWVLVGHNVSRFPVPGGWLYTTSEFGDSGTPVFVPEVPVA